MIPAPSPWAGEKTPNLNGEERFLRGGLDNVQLHLEEDSLQGHTHGITDGGHSHPYDDKYPKWGSHPGDAGYYDYSSHESIFTWDFSHARTSSKAKTNIKVAAVSGARTSEETRPKNMRVTYIMKIF